MVIPTLITYVYFNLLADAPASAQKTAMIGGKAIQFGLPAVWVFWVLKQPPRTEAQTRFGTFLGLRSGLVLGLIVSVAMFALYHLGLKPSGFMDASAGEIRDKIQGFNIDSVWKYAGMGVFYALVHSLLEEYYWRWFVFGQMRNLIPVTAAILVSSLGFMAHHVLVLAVYFGWHSPATYLFSASVAVGGIAWAWLYDRHGSLWGPWISHLMVDATIFLVGYDLVRDLIAIRS